MSLRILPSPELRAAFAALYPHIPTQELADAASITLEQAYRLANSLGIKKSAAYLSGPHACRLHRDRGEHVGKATQFKPGSQPWNKGTHYVAGGRSAETRFKKGRPAHEASNYRPIGSLRISADGYLERKTTDDQTIIGPRRWTGVHRLVWEAANGPTPAGHAVVFKSGRRSTDLASITLDAVELITRADLMRRNSVHRLPPEIKEVTMLRAQIRSTITKRRKKEEKAHASNT